MSDASKPISVTVHVSSTLRRFTSQQAAIEVQAATVGDALRGVADFHPAIAAQLFDASGNVRSFINVFLNTEDIRYLDHENTPLQQRDIVTILPAIAGG